QDYFLDHEGQQYVRVQLTQGRENGTPLDNQGLLVFRRDGSLADFQPPMPEGLSEGDAKTLLQKAHDAGLDAHGAALQLYKKDDGSFDVRATVQNLSQKDPHM